MILNVEDHFKHASNFFHTRIIIKRRRITSTNISVGLQSFWEKYKMRPASGLLLLFTMLCPMSSPMFRSQVLTVIIITGPNLTNAPSSSSFWNMASFSTTKIYLAVDLNCLIPTISWGMRVPVNGVMSCLFCILFSYKQVDTEYPNINRCCIPPDAVQSITVPSLVWIVKGPAIRPLAVATTPKFHGGDSKRQQTSLTATSKLAWLRSLATFW